MIRRDGAPLSEGDFALPALGYGGGSLFGVAREREASDLLGYAWTRGFRYFDTAPMYGSGLGEHWFGAGLRARPRDAYVLSSKVGRRLRPQPSGPADRLPFEVFYDYSYDGVMRSVEDSLQRLGLARMDIALLHDVNPRWHGERYEARYREAMEGAYPALARLRSEGIVRAIGVGLKGADVCLRFAREVDLDCIMLAGGYTLLEHDALDGLLPYCVAHDIAVIVASPFNSGILAKGAVEGATYFNAPAPAGVVERTRQMETICNRHGVPLGAAALQFTLAHPAVVCAVCGYRSGAEVDTSLAWSTLPIPGDVWDELKSRELIAASAPTSFASSLA